MLLILIFSAAGFRNNGFYVTSLMVCASPAIPKITSGYFTELVQLFTAP